MSVSDKFWTILAILAYVFCLWYINLCINIFTKNVRRHQLKILTVLTIDYKLKLLYGTGTATYGISYKEVTYYFKKNTNGCCYGF